MKRKKISPEDLVAFVRQSSMGVTNTGLIAERFGISVKEAMRLIRLAVGGNLIEELAFSSPKSDKSRSWTLV